MKEAILLAGGLGTRLSHVMTDTQKVMAPVGGVPFISFIMDELIKYGFDTFVLAVSYKENTVRDWFGDRYKSADIIYSTENEPLGTGGAIRQALSYCKSDCVPIINGDTFFDTDINALTAYHKEKGAEITVTVKAMRDFSRYGTVDFNQNGEITAFREKQPRESGFINGGIYCINRELLRDFPDRFSFEKEVLEKLEYRTYAFESGGYFIDIGIPQDYFSAQTEIPLLAGRNKFRAAFIDRDGTINKEVVHLHSKEQFEFIEGTPRALEKLREHGYLIIVVTNQAGIAKGLLTKEDLDGIHDYMKEQLKDIAFIDRICYCPYHKDAVIDRYRFDSPDRKPKPGMITKSVDYFRKNGIEIDLSRSVFIGDTETDINTGINAGIGTNVLVLSGHTKSKGKIKADLVADNLSQATEILLRDEHFPWEK